MFLELLLVIFVQLTVMFGKVGAMLIVMAAAAGSVVFVHVFVNWLVCSVMGFGTNVSRPSRKSADKDSSHNQFVKMSLEEIISWVEKNPRDLAACNQLLERYKKTDKHQEMADILEKMLDSKSEIDLEHRCMKTHQLADLYIGPLNNIECGLAVMRRFTQEYQSTPQAKLMQKKIVRVAERLDAQQRSANMN